MISNNDLHAANKYRLSIRTKEGKLVLGGVRESG